MVSLYAAEYSTSYIWVAWDFRLFNLRKPSGGRADHLGLIISQTELRLTAHRLGLARAIGHTVTVSTSSFSSSALFQAPVRPSPARPGMDDSSEPLTA